MFEVIITSVLTGRVVRKTFADSRRADRYLDQFFTNGISPRRRRDFRVEVHARLRPVATAPAVRAPTAA